MKEFAKKRLIKESWKAREGEAGDCNVNYNVRLPVFEGPFDLLLKLVEQEELDIHVIPIARIAEQYLDYVLSTEWIDIDTAGDFLVVAATLMQIKARRLLPIEESAEDTGALEGRESGQDPGEELIARLLEYQKFKRAAGKLQDLEETWRKAYPRWNSVEDCQQDERRTGLGGGLGLKDLVRALRDVLESLPQDEFMEVPRDEVSVIDKMEEITKRLENDAKLTFHELFLGRVSRIEIVATFLALLELIRLGSVEVRQGKIFGEIMILWRGSETGRGRGIIVYES